MSSPVTSRPSHVAATIIHASMSHEQPSHVAAPVASQPRYHAHFEHQPAPLLLFAAQPRRRGPRYRMSSPSSGPTAPGQQPHSSSRPRFESRHVTSHEQPQRIRRSPATSRGPIHVAKAPSPGGTPDVTLSHEHPLGRRGPRYHVNAAHNLTSQRQLTHSPHNLTSKQPPVAPAHFSSHFEIAAHSHEQPQLPVAPVDFFLDCHQKPGAGWLPLGG